MLCRRNDPQRGRETHLWPTGGVVECFGQFRRQKHCVAEADLWRRGDIGKLGRLPLFIVIVGCLLFGISEQDRPLWIGQKSQTGTRAFRALDLRTKLIWYILT